MRAGPAVLALAVMASMVLAGCLESPEEEHRQQRELLSRYRLVLHPVNYSWDASEKVLTGNVTLTSLFDGSAAPRAYVLLGIFNLDISFSTGSETRNAEWSLRYSGGDKLEATGEHFPGLVEPGETFVANWTVGRSFDANRSVSGLGVAVSYYYRVFPNVSDWSEIPNASTWYNVDVSYGDPCVAEAPTDRDTSRAECNLSTEPPPYPQPDFKSSLALSSGATDVGLPAMDHWPGWPGWEKTPRYAEPMQPVRSYMQAPSHRAVSYFNGSIHCGNCWCSSPRSPCHASDMSSDRGRP